MPTIKETQAAMRQTFRDAAALMDPDVAYQAGLSTRAYSPDGSFFLQASASAGLTDGDFDAHLILTVCKSFPELRLQKMHRARMESDADYKAAYLKRRYNK